MSNKVSNNRAVWLIVGVVTGLCIAYFWPHEPAQAITTDRSERFAIATTPVSIVDRVEGIFVLDFLTGRLTGRVLNPSLHAFTHSYERNIIGDFPLDPRSEPQFAIVAGRAQLTSKGRMTAATGVIYVAELLSGRVVCYGFPFNESNRPVPTVELTVLDAFQFREPVAP